MMTLLDHEREVLDMVAGTRPWPGQPMAWVNACLEFLRDSGFITDYIGAAPRLTDAGTEALKR